MDKEDAKVQSDIYMQGWDRIRRAGKERQMRKHKKYRIRKYSPAWYAKEAAAWTGAAAVALAVVAGAYAWILLLASMPV